MLGLPSLGSLWNRSKIEPVIICGKEIPVLTRFQALAGDCSKLSHATLKWVCKAFDTYGLASDHPFAQKVMKTLIKTKVQREKIDHTDSSAISEEPIVKQGLLTIKEMIAKIEKEGATWTAVHINNANDELFCALQQSCPNLETLRFIAREDAILMDLSDASVPIIAKMTKLKRFDYRAWNAFQGISQFDTLLSTPIFQTQMVEVNLMSPYIADTLIPILSKYTSLESLSLWTCGMPATSIAAIVLPKTLKVLSLINSNAFPGAFISDALLVNIAKSTQLKSLNLAGVSNSTDTQMQATINALINLTSFSMQGPQLSTVSLLSLPNTLLNLNLSDCTLIDSDTFDTFFSMKKSLVSVTLQLANGFTDAQIKSLPPLKHFYVESSWFLHLNGFPTSLESLAISGLTWINPSAFKGLANLPLKTLRLLGCSTFNNEAFNTLMNGAIVSTLEIFESYGGAFTAKAVGNFELMPNLKMLMLGQCYSFGLKGIEKLFTSNTLASRITHLYFDSAEIHKEMIPYLNNWNKLRVIFVGNTLELPFEAGNKALCRIEPIKEHNGDLMIWGGEPFSYDTFIHAI